LLDTGSAVEVGGCEWWGSHQAFPELRFALATVRSNKRGV